MDVSIILSTYNSPKWLEKVLWGYSTQTFRDFEIVIADDGSGHETIDFIEKAKDKFDFAINHVWHEDNGFRKCVILNKAIVESKGKYLIFSDGDCIPAPDFIVSHLGHQDEGRFLSGGYTKLSMEASEALTFETIESGEAFDPDYLHSIGRRKKLTGKHSAPAILRSWLNRLTTTSPTWNGHNASALKSDILAVNGFDERMVYGGEDRELGERLENRGTKGKQIRYSAICLHLDHPRSYATEEGVEFNKTIREETRISKKVWTDHGIQK